MENSAQQLAIPPRPTPISTNSRMAPKRTANPATRVWPRGRRGSDRGGWGECLVRPGEVRVCSETHLSAQSVLEAPSSGTKPLPPGTPGPRGLTISVSTVSPTSCGGNSAGRAFSIIRAASYAPAAAGLQFPASLTGSHRSLLLTSRACSAALCSRPFSTPGRP